MSGRLAPSHRQAGFTLVEMLLAVSILGIAVVTLVGGLMTAITVSDLGRRQSEGQVALRAFAEAVAADPYTSCASSYPASAFSAPAGYTASLAVTYWDGAAFTGSCGTDTGLQRVRLTVTATDGRGVEVLTMAKRKP